MDTKTDYTVRQVDAAALDLLKDAAKRLGKELGVPVSLQSMLRKTLHDAADEEKALQEAASQEYAKQASEDAQGD